MYLMHRFFSKVKHRNEVSVRLEIPQRGRFYGTMQCFCSAAKHLTHPLILHLIQSCNYHRAAPVFILHHAIKAADYHPVKHAEVSERNCSAVFCHIGSLSSLFTTRDSNSGNVFIDLGPKLPAAKEILSDKRLDLNFTAQPEFSPVEQHDMQ